MIHHDLNFTPSHLLRYLFRLQKKKAHINSHYLAFRLFARTTHLRKRLFHQRLPIVLNIAATKFEVVMYEVRNCGMEFAGFVILFACVTVRMICHHDLMKPVGLYTQ